MKLGVRIFFLITFFIFGTQAAFSQTLPEGVSEDQLPLFCQAYADSCDWNLRFFDRLWQDERDQCVNDMSYTYQGNEYKCDSTLPPFPQLSEAPPGKVWSPEHGHWHDQN